LAQLVLSVQRIAKEMLLQRIHGVVVSLARFRARYRARLGPQLQFRVIGQRRRQLFIQESLEADLLDMGDQLRRRTES